jgi:hypothetical protein
MSIYTVDLEALMSMLSMEKIKIWKNLWFNLEMKLDIIIPDRVIVLTSSDVNKVEEISKFQEIVYKPRIKRRDKSLLRYLIRSNLSMLQRHAVSLVNNIKFSLYQL